MNIFYVDDDPKQAAQALVDNHVVKMILESCQLLSTAHRVLDGKEIIDTSGKRKKKKYVLPPHIDNKIYQATHINHPSAKWVRESTGNYDWLFKHTVALLEEYELRYKKQHACYDMIYGPLRYLPEHIPINKTKTKIPCAMDEEFIISENPVENYRNYYNKGKRHLFKWKIRSKPIWVE
jgi:hypothetical protein